MLDKLSEVNYIDNKDDYNYAINSIIDILKSKDNKDNNIKFLRLKSIWSDIIANDIVLLDDFLFFMNFINSQFVKHFAQESVNYKQILEYVRSKTLQSYYNWLIKNTKIELTHALSLWCLKWHVYKLGEQEFVVTNWKLDNSVWLLLQDLSYVKKDSNGNAYSVNRKILLTDQWYNILVDEDWNIILEWDDISECFDDLLKVKQNYKKYIYDMDWNIKYWWLQYHDYHTIQDENYLASYKEWEDKRFSLVNKEWDSVFGWRLFSKIQNSFSDNWVDYICGISSKSGISLESKFVIVDIFGNIIYENEDIVSHLVVQTNSPFVIWVRDSKGSVIFIKDKQICKLKLDLPFNKSIWTIKLMDSIFVVYEQEWKKIDKIVSLEWNELFQRYFEENPSLTNFKLEYYFLIEDVGYMFCFEQKENKIKTYVIMDSQWNVRFGSENSKQIHEIKKTVSGFYLAEISKQKQSLLKKSTITNYYDMNGWLLNLKDFDILVSVKKQKVIKGNF